MERLKSMFKKTETSNLHYKRKVSIVSVNESICDSIYGITTPFQLLINDIKAGKPLSVNMLNYILTNLTDSQRYEILLEMNITIDYYHNLVNK